MKLYNLLGGTILALLLMCFFVMPQQNVFAIDFNFFDFSGEDDYQILSEFQSKRILQDFPAILYNQWILSKSNGFSDPMETTVVSLLKHISMLSMWNYLFKDVPLDVSFNVAKEGLDIARLIGTEDTSGMIGKLEKGTVNVAVNYLKDYFFRNQIKVSFGAMGMKYKTEFGEVDNPLQYIIMYKRIDDKRSKVVARIYSPREIIPPASKGSIGGVDGFANSLNYGEKLSPFIVEINGIMDDGLFGSYYWDKDNTTIKTVFPETVPDFGLKPKTWQEKYITEPIKNTIDSFSGILNFFTGSSNDLTEYVFKSTADQEAIDKEIKSINSGDSLQKDYPIKEIIVEEKKTATVKDTKKEAIIEEKKTDIVKEVKVTEKKIKTEPIICSKSSQYISSHDIIINEVAWMGSNNSSSDEWIELKNVSTSDINLKGWTLRDKEDQINITFEDITVSKGGFLLLERTDDNSVPFKTADLIYKGSLSNSGEELYLFDDTCLLRDFVLGNPKWPAGDSNTRKTMERNDDFNSWHTYSGGGSNNIWGTPKENNSSANQQASASLAVSNGTSSSVVSGGGIIAPTITYCSQSNLSPSNNTKVIINEVAWMGSENSSSDEWIELKNISNETISLENWQLLDSEDVKIAFASSAVIAPQGFYLLERTNDDSVPGVQMDKKYTGGLANSNELLRLFDANCQLMDEVLANPNWPAGESSSKKTMEKNNDLSGWHTYSGVGNNNIWGTPRENNSSVKQETPIDDPPPTVGEEETDPVTTYCSQSNLSSSNTSKVVINEVAWMGSENSSSDEWIELKNVSTETVNLSNWQLLNAENIKIVFDSSAIIAPQGFYLLERTDDNSVPNVSMDNKYTGALLNDNESLRLFDANCQLMDEVLANPNWPAGDNESKKTMERNNDLSNWHTYSSGSADSLSGLWGSPKAENSPVVIIEEEEEEIPPEEDEPVVENGNHLLITEVQTKESEYIEIYNQTDATINLCPSEDNCFYLSYYSPLAEWYDPSRNWKFPSGSVISPNSYYVIDVFGNDSIRNDADWKVKSLEGNDYGEGQIGNSAGSLSIFSSNPKYETKEGTIEPTEGVKIANTIASKIDTISWKGLNGDNPIIREGESFLFIPESSKVMGRKWSNQKYKDTNNNLDDFQLENQSLRNHAPKPPEKIQDLISSVNEEQKNSVVLSWTAPIDEDTLPQDLDYEIYYSRNGQIDDSSLKNIKDYVNIIIVSGESNKRSTIIKDLFYDSEYHFKIIAKDPEKNTSPLSEDASFVTSKANHQKRAPYIDFKRSGHSQFNGPIGSSIIPTVLIEGDQQFTFNNDFTSTLVIDENGTIYFGGINNGSKDFYAYSPAQKKWSINCSEACGFYPSLGKDGTVYFSSNHSVYAVSPSGKIIWKKDYTRVYTNSIVIDSEEKIYFLASKETRGPVLFSIDKNGLETGLYDAQEILNGLNPSSFTELVIDDSNNIYFAINDFVIKYNSSGVVKKQLFPKYEQAYPGSTDKIAVINQVFISFSGTLLLSINNGRYISAGDMAPVLYALDSNLSQVLWFKNNYNGPIGFNEEEFYYTRVVIGSYPMITYLGAASISDGSMKWERMASGVNFVISDSQNRIYFTKPSQIFGYDSNNMPESLDTRLFYLSSGVYYGNFISIGDKKTFFSDTQRVYIVDVSQ
jgi:hypothetical protein